MYRLLKPVLVGLLAFLVVLVPGGVAVAHDELLSSDPADGSTVEAPEELVLTFSGEIAQVGAQLQITGGAGGEVADGDPEVRGTDLVQPLTDVGPGDYEVVWRVTSSDGHPISGEFTFTVEATAEEEATEDATDEATEEETTPEATEDAVTQDATPEATEEATPEATEDATEDATDQQTDGSDSAASTDGGGLPGWVWAVFGVIVLALLALLARTWSRRQD